jgi:hypothetical protein
MGTNITVYLPTARFFGRVTMLDLRSGIYSQKKLSHKKEVPADGEVEGLGCSQSGQPFSPVFS